MTAPVAYSLAFLVLPGLVIAAAVWYFLFSHYCYRRRKSKAMSILLASAEVAAGLAVVTWWFWPS